MKSGLSRRSLLRGLIAAPAVVYVGHLMPLRGIKFDPIVRLQSWPLGTERWGEWWVHEGKLSRTAAVQAEMRRQFGKCYSTTKEDFKPWVPYHPLDRPTEEHREFDGGSVAHPKSTEGRDQYGFRETLEERRARPNMVHAESSWILSPQLTSESFAQSTESMRAQLASICQWGA